MSKEAVVTIVCTGNTCRSPMAEVLLRHALDARDPALPPIRVQSAGVSAYAGDPASENAVRAVQKVGLNLESHRSRKLTAPLLEESDLIIAMTESHLALIEHFFPDSSVPAILFREPADGPGSEVPDPFGGSLGDYIETRDSLAAAIPALLKELQTRFSQPAS
jgi:protein-tyrosine-phosphatase